MTKIDVNQDPYKPFNTEKEPGTSITEYDSEAESMNIKIVSEPDEFLKLRDLWKDLADVSDCTVFQTFTWNKTWWKYFGEGKSLFVLTMYHEGLLIGILPCFIDNMSMWDVGVYSCLRMLGTTVNQPEGEDLKGLKTYSDYTDMIVRPGYEKEFGARVTDFLFSGDFSFHEIVFEEIREDSNISKWLLPGIEKNNYTYSSKNMSACPFTHLEDTWEKYLSTMSKRRRNHVRKYIRYVEDPEIKVYDLIKARTNEQVSCFFDHLARLHQIHWNSLAQPGVFAEERYYHFLKEVTQLLFKEGVVWLSAVKSIEDGGKIVAVDLLLAYKKRMYLLQRAYDSGEDVHAHSPGTVLLYNTIRQGIREEYIIFDFLRGEDSYKYRTATHTVQNKKIRIPLPTFKLRHKIAGKFPSVKRKVRLELDKLKLVTRGKSVTKAAADYSTFIAERFKKR